MQKFQLGLIAMLICCVAFVSCERTQKMMAPAEPTADTMPADMADMADMTDMMDMMADYMSWAKVELPAPPAEFADPKDSGSAHGAGTRTVYINEAGAAAQAAAMETYPVGTMIVKEIMDATNTFVHRVATMTKTDDEMYAAHAGWMYTQSQRESADAELLPQAGDIPGGSSDGCHGCHAKATTDSVFVKLPAEGEYAEGEEVPDYEKVEGMALIPAGTFQMGSTDADAQDNEQPVHTVHLDAFYMDIYEVTNAQFKAFVDANPQWQKDNIEDRFHDDTWKNYLELWSGTDYPAGKADHPVTHVSWYAAMAYAEWAGKRLPTEAEWEYAARGGLAGQKYPWGDTITLGDANWASGDTTAVGQYAANGYGLYDMAGNVWEWCLDAYDSGFYAVSENSQNPLAGGETLQELRENFTSIPTTSWRVLRGGSWYDSAPFFLRVALRYGNTPAYLDVNRGFRCARGTVTP